MNKSKKILLAAALVLAAAGAHAVRGSVPLVERPRVELLANDGKAGAAERVRAAVVQGSQIHHWTVQDEQPGELTLRQQRGAIELLVKVRYDALGYQVQYVSSTGLYYEQTADGGAKIHPTYNNWMKNLDSAIATVLPSIP
ncbi:hypothetical protein SNE35_11025 [Paucibacter sp. R3-3]|uniref:Lipoprotein n=1 Tax=Roseateles agri TaxID=3098619 RepID=A0ABU5DFI8_9BURK|nr:hypothetical protein [Paucibacter sp. R3-3]MDY0745045.1 hypothetical protein [Paucibacter sp. R3-3]